MDTKEAERIALAIKSLENCPGWTEWLRPVLELRLQKIKDELVADLSEEATLRLRMEHRVLKDSVLGRPAATMIQVRKAGPAAAGAANAAM